MFGKKEKKKTFVNMGGKREEKHIKKMQSLCNFCDGDGDCVFRYENCSDERCGGESCIFIKILRRLGGL